MKRKTFLLLISIWMACVGAEEKPRYGWPLPFDNGVTSTFMEFRSNHFHAGVDLRTYQTTGFPVFAISDGTVYLVRMVKNDSGRTLYLRHADGNISAYFHLERFNDELEALTKRIQAEKGVKYFGNYQLEKPLLVKRGDCIAFSGESGSGFAHLHVEVRDNDWQALNPFQLLDFPNADPYPPSPLGVLLKTREDSLINGECGEIYLPFTRHGDRYILSPPFQVQGTFDPVLHVYDLTDAGKHATPYSIHAYLDEKPCFVIQFDRFRREDNNQLGMVYDLFRSNRNTVHLSLFSQPGFDMEKTKVDFYQALKALPDGNHELHLVVLDHFLNRSEVSIPFTKTGRNEPTQPGHEDAAPRMTLHNLKSIEVQTYINRNGLVVKLPGPSWSLDQVKLKLIQGGDEKIVDAEEMKNGIFFFCRPLNRDPDLDLRFLFFNENRIAGEIQKKMTVAVLTPESAASVHLDELEIDFGEKSVREPKLIWVRKAEQALGNNGYPVLVKPFDLSPYDVPFLDAVYVRFRLPENVKNPLQVGIFKYGMTDHSWRYVPTVSEGLLFSTRVLIPGVFTLMRDIFPPNIRLISRRRQSLGNFNQLIIRIRDRGKGVDEDSILVRLNGQILDCEYDPDWNWVKIDNPQPSRKGENILQVDAADRAGNRSSRQFRIVLH